MLHGFKLAHAHEEMLHCAKKTHAHEEGNEASRKLKFSAHEIEAAHNKQHQTQSRAKFFLDSIVYEEIASENTEMKTWIDAETCYDIKFEISLCTQSPPGFSRLFLKTDDALPDSPTSTLEFDDEKKRVMVEAMTCCYNAIMLHARVETGTFPCFRHDYFLLKNDVPTPTIFRLPEMPGPHEINMGILHHGSGHYTVAVLKESMTSAIPSASSVLSGYQMSKVSEGPSVCIFSTLTEKWICRPVSLPDEFTSWNWDIDVVLANGSSFWWVDLHCGILSYDVDQQLSALGLVPLPSACFQVGDTESYMREDRCVGITNGELRCAHIFRKSHILYDYGDKSQQCEDSVKIWSWRDGSWVEDYEMKFAELWEGTSYSSRGLPKFVPAYPTIDPSCPYVVNFFLPTGHCSDGYVVGVNLLSMEIQYCGEVHKGLLNVVGGLEIFEFSEAGAKEDRQEGPWEMAVTGISTAPTKRRRVPWEMAVTGISTTPTKRRHLT